MKHPIIKFTIMSLVAVVLIFQWRSASAEDQDGQTPSQQLKPSGVAFTGGGLGRYTPPGMRKWLKGKRRRAMQKRGETGFLDGDW
jgi:hypothetical protein